MKINFVKKIILVSLVSILFPIVTTTAQSLTKKSERVKERGQRQELICRYKHFIIKGLSLSDAEQRQLETAIDRLSQAKFEVWKETYELHKKIKQRKATEEQIDELIDAVCNARISNAILEKSFYEELKTFLKPSQIWYVRQSHQRFARKHRRIMELYRCPIEATTSSAK